MGENRYAGCGERTVRLAVSLFIAVALVFALCPVTVAHAAVATQPLPSVLAEDVALPPVPNKTSKVKDGFYRVYTKNSKYLNLNNTTRNNGIKVNIQKKLKRWAQEWRIDNKGAYLIIYNAGSGKALTIKGGATKSGAIVQTEKYKGHASQKWILQSAGKGWFNVVSQSGMMLRTQGVKAKAKLVVVDAGDAAKYAKSKQAQFRFKKLTYKGTYIDINLSTQHLVFIKGGKRVFDSDIVSARRGTPTGTWKIRNKAINHGLWYGKFGYRWMGYNEPYGIHDATWMPWFGGYSPNAHGRTGSHGCINMPLAKIKALYKIVAVGTKVKIHY